MSKKSIISKSKINEQNDIERVVPNNVEQKSLFQEHLVRYHFASNFIQNKSVLDAACGTGYGSSLLLEKGSSKVTGIDNSIEAINFCKKNYFKKNLNFELGNCEKLTFKKSEFDIVISFETVEHLENPNQFLIETKRVLNENGILIISTPNIETYQENNPFHKHEFTTNEFKTFLKKNFKNVLLFYQFYPSSSMIGNYEKTSLIETKLIENNSINESEYLYIIAICSDQQIPLIPNNNFIFKESNLFSGEKSHLKELRNRNNENEMHLKELRQIIMELRRNNEKNEMRIEGFEEYKSNIENSKVWRLLRFTDKLFKK